MNKKLNDVSFKKNSTRSSWQIKLTSFSLIAQTAELSMEFLNFISYSFFIILLYFLEYINLQVEISINF